MPTLLLSYTLSTNPTTVEASPNQGNPNTAALTITATNESSSAVTLQVISILVPIGAAATDLTNAAAMKISQTPPTGWQTDATITGDGSATFVFTPTGGANATYTVQPNGSLTFVLSKIAINNQIGTATLVLTEASADCQGATCPTQDLPITKYPGGWGNVEFWTEDANTSSGASVTLNWLGPGDATYTIQYVNNDQIVTLPAEGQPPFSDQGAYTMTLSQTTVFTLTVAQTVNGVTLTKTPQLTITVIPAITSFTGTMAYGGPNGPVLNLTWQTSGASSVQASWTPQLLNPNPTASALVSPALPGTYTITAIGANGTPTAKQSLQLSWEALPSPIQVGNSPSTIVVSPDGAYAYVVNSGDVTASVIEISTLQTIAPINVGHSIQAIAVSPDGRYVFVANIYTLWVIDVNKSFSGTPINLGMNPLGALAVSPDGAYVFMVNTGDHTLSVIDTNTLQVIQTITLKKGPDGDYLALAVSLDSRYVFVANQADGTVSVIDTNNLQATPNQTISVGEFPRAITLSSDGAHVFVGNGDTSISVIAINHLHATPQTIQTGISPTTLVFSPDGAYLFAGNVNTLSAAEITVIASNNLQGPQQTISVVDYLIAISLSPDGAYLFAVSSPLQNGVNANNIGTVSVIDTNSLQIIKTITVGNSPSAIAVSQDGAYVFVANYEDNTVSVLTLQVTG